MKQSIIKDKSKAFALDIIKLYQSLTMDGATREYIMSKQLLRCGTSIGANVKEALRGQSRADFRAKMNIALKEADETEYWLELLYESGYIDSEMFNNIYQKNKELIKILMSIVKTSEQQKAEATAPTVNCEL